ncbi:MAG: hypothetical protein ACRC62_22880 [Microcoleus sp.]
MSKKLRKPHDWLRREGIRHSRKKIRSAEYFACDRTVKRAACYLMPNTF